MDPVTDGIAPRGAWGSDGDAFTALLLDDARQARAELVDLPPYAVRRAPRVNGDEALRPVQEDEYEELDEDPSAWDPTSAAGRRPAADPPALRPAGPSKGAGIVRAALGRAVKRRRWVLHESQDAYARRTGRSQGVLSRIERGRKDLSVRDLIAIAQETGRTVRLQVVPDGAVVDVSREVATSARLGTDGSVRVALGPEPETAPWRGFGPPPAPPTGARPGPRAVSPAGRWPGPFS
ncbi:helix-turn-helix transcriptional regulator [Patulibacter sp. NPDC049589]|uniref:helix-turn-helix domain-containing protein n=1 Tax=Patulibacter sp. NPDC049589 TaxID=3154731 RepID=UPI00343351EF